MGRLTEALRRAADAADKEPPQALHDGLNTPAGDLNGATDDLFPIEIPDPAAPAAVAADPSASTGEPAGAAVIVPAPATALPVTAADVKAATPSVRVTAAYAAPSDNGSHNG